MGIEATKWPQQKHKLDNFPLVTSVEHPHGDFDVRMVYADPVGTLINKVLERIGDSRRYIAVFYEDRVCAEGVFGFEEALAVAKRLTIGSDGYFSDPLDTSGRNTERKLFDNAEPLKSHMTEAELALLARIKEACDRYNRRRASARN